MTIEYSEIIHPIILSFKTVGVNIFLFLIFGIPLAYLLSKKELKLKWLLEVIVTMPLIFPPIAVGFFLLMLLGRDSILGGFLNSMDISFIFDFYGIVLAGFIAGLPLMVKPLQSAIGQFPQEIKEASYISGKSQSATLLLVILPTIKKSLIAAVLIASARAMGEVGITLMLGGNIIGKTDTISLAIFNAVFDGEYEIAMIFSSILVAISLILFISLYFLEKKEKLI